VNIDIPKELEAMVITTLMDNHAIGGSSLVAEHGFSCLLELPHTTVLLDTGTTGAFIENARLLGKDLSKVKHMVISHGHYDHAGGLRTFWEQEEHERPVLWTGKGFMDPKYSVKDGGHRYTGIDFDQQYIESHAIPWQTVTEDMVEIEKGVWIVTNFERTHKIEKLNPHFQVVRNGIGVLDEFNDEVMLVVESSKGLVLIVGCSHPGILNMVDTVRSRFPLHIHALLGGIHLVQASEERINEVVTTLDSFGIDRIGVSHCTGDEASLKLSQTIKGYFVNEAGYSLKIDS
jgi:7,8-dihydropterin-6-yl-methyl-4-(beta-D-ribofuranosyl)aminobenzene 5'-phosphate synthase